MNLLSIELIYIVTGFLYLNYILSFNHSEFEIFVSSFNVYLLFGGQKTYIKIIIIHVLSYQNI